MMWKRLFVFAVVLTAALLLVQWMMSGEEEAETETPKKPAEEEVQTAAPAEESENDPVSDMVDEMSLEEKIGQMMFAGFSGTEMSESIDRLINTYKIGGIIFYKHNIQSAAQMIALQNEIREGNHANKLPLLFGVDQEGGRISRMPDEVKNLPASLAIGNVNNREYSYEIGTLLGKQVKAFGFNLDFAPVLDVHSNPNNPVIGDRSFGTDPKVVSTHGVETMKGIQSENIIPVVKHFPGHGDTSVDSHLELPIVNKNLDELEQLELIPFAEAVENGADVVMAAHILLPQIDQDYPSSMSKVIMTDILREQLGFNGVIITDDMTMGAIVKNYSVAAASVQSVKAGMDIILVAHGEENIIAAAEALKAAVENGEITEERINESVARIIRLKQKYNLDDAKVPPVNIEKLNQEISDVLNKYN